jgi:hypothetical protein
VPATASCSAWQLSCYFVMFSFRHMRRHLPDQPCGSAVPRMFRTCWQHLFLEAPQCCGMRSYAASADPQRCYDSVTVPQMGSLQAPGCFNVAVLLRWCLKLPIVASAVQKARCDMYVHCMAGQFHRTLWRGTCHKHCAAAPGMQS